MPVEVPDLPSTSRATMFRTAVGSEVLDRAAREVCVVENSDEAVFHPRHSDWLESSSVYTLVKTRDELATIPDINTLGGKKVQLIVMKILRGNLDDRALHDTISKRLQHFSVDRPRERAETFVFNMAPISKFIKPVVAANLIGTVCNAHPTVRRFPQGGSHSACRFGCYAVGWVCVLHYPCCPVVLGFVSEVVSARSLSDLLWVAILLIPQFFFWRECISRT